MAKKAAKKTPKKVVQPVKKQEPNNQSVIDEDKEKKFSVAVIGDAWYRSFIASENKNCYRLFLNSGAARLCEMIKAAFYDHAHYEEHKDDVKWDEKHKCNIAISEYLVPDTDIRWCRYGQLKKYNITENFKNFNNDVLSGIFNKETYNNNVWRIEKNFGACPVIGMMKTDKKNKKTKPTGKEKVWIIHQDTPESLGAIEKEKNDHNENNILPQKKELVKTIQKKFKKSSYEELPHFFWYHYEFGNDTDIKNDPLKSFLLDDEKLAVNILSKTIVFLRLQGLTKYEIGRREDLSVEECLRSVLKGFENRNMQRILKKCKAIVISCGIELAFLIHGGQGKEESKNIQEESKNKQEESKNIQTISDRAYPTKIHAIFRYIQTADYYQNDRGFVQALGSLMMTSCLKELEGYFSKGKEDDDVFIKSLITGIHDGLWRMMFHYNSGYLVKTDEDKNDEKIYKKFFGDTQIRSNYFTHFKTIYAATSFKNHTEKNKCEKDAQEEVDTRSQDKSPSKDKEMFKSLREHYKKRDKVWV